MNHYFFLIKSNRWLVPLANCITEMAHSFLMDVLTGGENSSTAPNAKWQVTIESVQWLESRSVAETTTTQIIERHIKAIREELGTPADP